ncbi:hypothetical protein ATHL_01083 [Anaerolinea thermolimosa]|uniref:hypothetical protein n=1 Tax=Anaerolinea thermolimosa TaxID=229919 RepID=UPI00078539CA|nr:hypothetical protein [Anaerolinea thermolimosa]GAP06235.1 hypothetical protein ATHL_01083 [Anaerolinea thermolimosa]
MADTTWKQTERAIAGRLNGKRQGAVGRTGADVVNDWLAVEVKHRRRLPQWLKDALTQARSGAGDRLPIVVLHEAGQRHSADLVLVRLADFQDWFGEVTHDPYLLAEAGNEAKWQR